MLESVHNLLFIHNPSVVQLESDRMETMKNRVTMGMKFNINFNSSVDTLIVGRSFFSKS